MPWMTRLADTRERLIAAAEELFGANGIEAVSLREIVRAAGARNTTALQYHFGDRAGLVRAVLERHHLDVDTRRHALLDAYEADGEPDLWALARALVQPLAAKLAEPEGGAAYLQIMAELDEPSATGARPRGVRRPRRQHVPVARAWWRRSSRRMRCACTAFRRVPIRGRGACTSCRQRPAHRRSAVRQPPRRSGRRAARSAAVGSDGAARCGTRRRSGRASEPSARDGAVGQSHGCRPSAPSRPSTGRASRRSAPLRF